MAVSSAAVKQLAADAVTVLETGCQIAPFSSLLCAGRWPYTQIVGSQEAKII